MEVVQDQHEGLTLSRVLEEGGNGVEKAEACRPRFQRARRSQVRQFTPYLGNDLGDFGGAGSQLCGELFRTGLLDVGPYGLDPGPVWRCALFFIAPTPKDLRAQGFSEGCQLLGGASLADAGLARQHYQPPVACQGIIQGGFKLGHLLMATYEDATYVVSGTRLGHSAWGRRLEIRSTGSP